MLKEILGTISSRYLIALLNLVLVFINAKVLRLTGMGTVGLIIASVNIIVVFNSLYSCNTLVYFMKKYSIRHLFPIAYVWACIGSLLACALLWICKVLPAGYEKEIFGLAILNTLVAANTRFLLGANRVKLFNLSFILQGGLPFFLVLIFYFLLHRQTISAYLYTLYIANGIAWIFSLIPLFSYLRKRERPESDLFSYPGLIKEMTIYGLWGGLDNLAETLTTRLNYFLVEHFTGIQGVGLLDGATKIAESVWHISRSIGFIEYKNMAVLTDTKAQIRTTLTLLQVAGIVMVGVMGIIVILPEDLYTRYLFSPEFAGMRRILLFLSVGIVAFGCNTVLSHYFIGTGKIRYSTLCSSIGLLVLLGTAVFAISHLGVTGSAISTSVAYIAMFGYSIFRFKKEGQLSGKDFVPDWEEIKNIRNKTNPARDAD